MGFVPAQVPKFAVIAFPTAIALGVKEGAKVLLGRLRIGPKLEENFTADSVPLLLVAVVAVTLTTRNLSNQALFRGTVAEVSAVEVQPDGTAVPALEADVQRYQR